MRCVVQRVSRAAVEVDGHVVGSIGPGLLALVAVTGSDARTEAVALASKLTALRIFPDSDGKMNRSVLEVGGEVLLVSQFTLYGDLRKGNRPSFISAAPPEVAAPLIEQLAVELRGQGINVATGSFGAMMKVDLVNDGPVTLTFDVVGGRVV